MRLIYLVSLFASFVAGAEVPSKPDYRCVAERAYGIAYENNGPAPVEYSPNSVFFLMHISNIPAETLKEIHKSNFYFKVGYGKDLASSSVEDIRKSLNYIASLWNPIFDYMEPDMRMYFVDQTVSKGVYFIRRSNENPNEAGHYYPRSACRHVSDYNQQPAVACYNSMQRDSFVFSESTGKFEFSRIGTWLDEVPNTGALNRPEPSYFEQGICEKYYR